MLIFGYNVGKVKNDLSFFVLSGLHPVMFNYGRNIIRRLWHNERGSPAIEFAFAAPAVLLMLIAIIEFGMIMVVHLTMENALRDASRFGITGQTPSEGKRDDYIVALINNHMLNVVDVAHTKIEIKAYPTFADIGEAEYIDANNNGAWDPGEASNDCNGNGSIDNDRGTPGAGEAGQAVLYHIEYDWPLLTPVLKPFVGSDGTFHLEANLAVRNEPWDIAAANDNPVSCGPK
jgi:Flp pilus assembly protein TadG